MNDNSGESPSGWRSGIVQITTAGSRGTGALIAKQRVLTALHVVSTVDDGQLVLLESQCEFGDGVPRSATVQEHSRAQDWALLRCDDAPSQVQPLSVAFARPHEEGAGGAGRVARTSPHAWESFGFPNFCPTGTNLGGTISGWAPAHAQLDHGEIELLCTEAQQIRQHFANLGIEDIDRLRARERSSRPINAVGRAA